MSNFAPIYTNTGGKNIINTLQRKHVIAVLNAKSIVREAIINGPAHSLNKADLIPKKKKKKSNGFIRVPIQRPISRPLSPNPTFSLNKINTLNAFMNSPKTQINDYNGEVKSLLRNLISIDKKSLSNIKILKKNLKIKRKKEKTEAKAKKTKLFYVSDFFTKKEKGLTINSKKNLDKMLPNSQKLEKQFQIPITKPKIKVRCLSSNPSNKKIVSVEKNSKTNLKTIEQLIKKNANIQTSDNKNKELLADLEILFEKGELSSCKKKIILHLMRNQIIELDGFNKLTKELHEKFGKKFQEELKSVLDEIENHIFK